MRPRGGRLAMPRPRARAELIDDLTPPGRYWTALLFG